MKPLLADGQRWKRCDLGIREERTSAFHLIRTVQFDLLKSGLSITF